RPFDIAIATSQFSPSTVIFRKACMPVSFDGSLRRFEDYRLWGDLVFQGRALWKLTEFLSARDQPHMKANGLSSDHDALLTAHLRSIDHFHAAGFIGEARRRFMRIFLRVRFWRHGR
ncbi:MAG: glycosyltransferase family 2 protein, partial [Hyphomicrobiales bacterium]|nr:glycosyltransferase family 2 protein [Hyphomicrobiales bacterium]